MKELELKKPIIAHGETLSVLEFDEPTGKDVRELGYPYQMNQDESVRLLAHVVSKYIVRLANTWQKQFPLDYGKVRLWGSVAFVIGSALTGKLVSMFDYRVILALLTLGVASMLLGFLIRPTIQPQGASRQQESTGWSAWLALVRQNWRFLACVCLLQGAHVVHAICC